MPDAQTPLGEGGANTDRWSIAAIIPTHNRGALVARAVDSALGQIRPPDEVIVVDDGSTDDTAEQLVAYGDRIRLIRKPQGGVSSARNLGVESSSCDFVAFLDSDDLWDPSHLLRMDQAVRATDGKAVLYFSNMHREVPELGDDAWESSDFAIDGRHELRLDGRDWLFKSQQPMLIQASLISRDVYLGVGGSDTRFPCRGDTHLLFRIGLAGPICAVAGFAGVQTRDDPTSITTTLSESLTYVECTLRLYYDIVRRTDLERVHTRVARRRLAAAHWDYAKHHGLRSPVKAFARVGQATRYDPPIFPRRLGNRLFNLGGDSDGAEPQSEAPSRRRQAVLTRSATPKRSSPRRTP
jgi:glycosyltransferase involved in cell wall biosynthesis